MNEEVVRTGVDELLELLKTTAKIPLAEAATKLNANIDIIQSWVDFLVEEGIVGIEYKFTTPFIYLNKPVEDHDSKKPDVKDEDITIEYFRDEFYQKARKSNIPEDRIKALWKNHLAQALELKKKFFMFEVDQRKLPNKEILWHEYYEAMMLN